MDGSLLKNKDDIILELTHRPLLQVEPDQVSRMPHVYKREEAPLMDGRDARYHEDRAWTDIKYISQTHA